MHYKHFIHNAEGQEKKGTIIMLLKQLIVGEKQLVYIGLQFT